jgi:hypothetical protein
MAALTGRLPVLGADRNVLQLVRPERAQELIESGRAIAVGTKTRVRALIVAIGSDEFLRISRPPRCKPESHKQETDDNPKGVWTFRVQRWSREVI